MLTTTSAIDMLTPSQACAQLHLDEPALIDAVNAGRLAAYDLGDGIRFRASDVRSLAADLIATKP